VNAGAQEKVLVICPGRGTYTAAELGYLKRFKPASGEKKGGARDIGELLGGIDRYRVSHRLPSITELDQATSYSGALHASAEHAPALIYACAIADFRSLDPAKCEVVGVTGNSMGWYIALAAAGALSPDAAIHLINTMGGLTGASGLGGQLIYPCFDEEWRRDSAKDAVVLQAMLEVRAEEGSEVFDSIHLGGFRVIAGNDAGIRSLMKKLPPLEGRYPMKLVNHSAFHTPLMQGASNHAFELLGAASLFQTPQLPLIDGEGHIWQPYSTDLAELMDYTLGRQVTEPYDFTLALKVAIRELAPTRLALLGPGSNLGGAIGQTLVDMKWRGIGSKTEFTAVQEKSPYLVSLGRPEQRGIL
jgi:[acyl-carrier-protein] S-malonyltransferase